MGDSSSHSTTMRAVLLSLMLTAIFTVAAQRDVDTLVSEFEASDEEPSLVQVPAEFVPQWTPPNLEETNAKSRVSNAKVLSNVRALKAYCVAAHDQARSLVKMHSAKTQSSLVAFVVKFGTRTKQNIVTEYANVLGQLRRHFKSGLGSFLLHHLNAAVTHSTGAVTVYRDYKGATKVGFSHTAMGFSMKPTYLKRLAVSLATFSLSKLKVDKATKGADSAAATAWLLSGTNAKYRSFYERIKSKVKAKSERLWKKVIAGALKGERKAWKTHKRIKPQTPGGIAGASKVFARLAKQLKLPSDEQMRFAAKKLADRWRKHHKAEAKTISSVIKKVAKKATKATPTNKKKAKKKSTKKKPTAFQKALKLAHLDGLIQEDNQLTHKRHATATDKAFALANFDFGA